VQIHLTLRSAAHYSALWKSENICTLEKRAVMGQLQRLVRRMLARTDIRERNPHRLATQLCSARDPLEMI